MKQNNVENIFDTDALAAAIADGVRAKEAVKEYLRRAEESLSQRHLAGEKGRDVCRAYSAMIDGLLTALFSAKSAELKQIGKTALVALGGYGRGMLNIKSDIDLTLLYGGAITKEIEVLTRDMLYLLWDAGLDMGFAIRTVEETVELAKTDLKTRTAIIDSRFIHGDEKLFNKLNDASLKHLFDKKNAKEFIKEKTEETRLRHAKFGGSVYILEPNVKEGEGGLRDMHHAEWVAKARFGRDANFVTLGLLSKEENDAFDASVDFLLRVRNDIHLNAKRKSDQLTFDNQERIAALFGYKNSEHALAVESFMQDYYKCAWVINRYSRLAISRCMQSTEKKSIFRIVKKVALDRDFLLIDDEICAAKDDVFEKNTSALVGVFRHSQSLDRELEQRTRDLILKSIANLKGPLTSVPGACAIFREILGGLNLFKTITEMHNLNVLDKLIPEFADINSRVQHDIYHVYTVDAHTFFAIREAERLRDMYKPDFPLLSTIFEEIEEQSVLMLAILLHDIGKSRGKGHADKGADMAPEICSRLGFSESDSAVVRFLIKNHLILADTAQYRDIHDEKLIIDFAKKIGDAHRLNLLYILTFADVRAVGPDVWNQWKGSLFQELYFKALSVLERGTFEPEDAGKLLRETKTTVMEELKNLNALPGAAPASLEETVDEHFSLAPARYPFSTSPASIVEHITLIRSLIKDPYRFSVKQNQLREYTELTICTHDTHGLFSMITGVMAANSVDILGAQINTFKNGIVIDALQVVNSFGELLTDREKLTKIESDLAGVITGKIRVAALVGRRKPSILDNKAKPAVKTRVAVDNEVSESFTVLDIHAQNRIGLLYDITSALSRLGLYIHVAKISTKGDDAADIFYIKDIFGQKIFYNEKLREIVEAIVEAIDRSGDKTK